MSERDRIAEIEDLTIKEFKVEIQNTLEKLKDGIKPGNTIELLAASMNIGMMGNDLKNSVERWLQLDLWEKVDQNK